MKTRAGLQLTDRDLAVIYDIARYKLLARYQIQQRHFPQATLESTANRLALLVRHNLLSRVFSYPKIRTTETPVLSRPTSIFFFAQKNHTALKNYLEKNARADDWQDFLTALSIHGKTDEFSQQYLQHEIGISQFFLALEQAQQPPMILPTF
jgi:hypothetical protein